MAREKVMKNKRRPRQATTTTKTKRRPPVRAQKRLQKLITPSPRIERDFYVPNNPQYFSTISDLHNYVGDNGDLFPHLNRVGSFDRDNWSQLSEILQLPTTSPSDLADIVSAFDCIDPVDDERAVQCVSEKRGVQEQLSLPRAMNSFNDCVTNDDISDKVILRQLLLGDTKTYSTDDVGERKELFEALSETNDCANTVKFGNLFRDSVGVVVDQADFLKGIYGQDEKLCCSVEPAEHYVPAPDLTLPYLSKLPNPNKPVAESFMIAYDPIDNTKEFIVENLLNDSVVDDEAVDYYCDLEEFEEILDTIWKDLPEPKSVDENDVEISCDIRALESPQPSVSSLSAPTLPLQTEIDTTPSIIPRFGDNEVDSTSDRSAGSLKLHNSGGDGETSSVAEAVSSSLTGDASICDHAAPSLSRSKNSTENLLEILEEENSIDCLDVEGNVLYKDENMIYKTITPTTAPDDDVVADATSPSVPSSTKNETPCSSPATLAAIASITASPKNAIFSRKRSTSSNFTCDSPVLKLRRTASTCEQTAADLSDAFSPTTQQRYDDDCALGNAVRNGNSSVTRYGGATSTVSAMPTELGTSSIIAFCETSNCSQNQPCQVVMDSTGSSPPLFHAASTSDVKAAEKVVSPEATHKMFWKKKIKYSRSLSITEERDYPSPFDNEKEKDAQVAIEDACIADEPMEHPGPASIASDAVEGSKHLKVSDDGHSVVKTKKKLVRSKKSRKSVSKIDAGRRTRSQSKQQHEEQKCVEQPEEKKPKEITESEHTDPTRANTSPVKDSNTLPKVSLNLLIQKNIVDFTPVLDLNLVHENLYRRHVNFLQLKDLTVAKCKVMRKTLHRDRFRLQQIINLMEKLSKLLYYYYVWECRELKRERQSDTSTAYSREWEELKRKEIVENMETTLPMTGNQRFDSKIFEHFHSFLQTLSDESSRSTQTFHAKERLLYDSMNLPHVYSGRSILLPVKQYVRSYVHNALSYDTCKYLLENDGNVSEKNNSKSIGVSANANAQTAASLSVCLVEKQIPSVEEISERGGSVPRVRCVQSWKREYEKFYYTLNFLFIINYKFVLYSHHCNFLISNLTKQTEERDDTTGFNILPRSFWRKSDDANFPYVFTPILKGHSLSDKLDMCVPSPGNPQTPASVKPVDTLQAEMDDDDHYDVLTHSESAESASEENEVSSYAKPTIINVLTLQQNEPPSISDSKNDSSSPPLSLKILCEQPASSCNESSLDILEINRQRSVALNRHLCFEKKAATKNEPDIEQVLQHQLNMVKILNRDSMDFLDANDAKNLRSTSDSRRTNNQYTLLERVALRAFFAEMSVAEKQQTLISIKEEQYLFFYLERMFLEHHYAKDKCSRVSDCAFLDQQKH